jgi:hypothetical protein
MDASSCVGPEHAPGGSDDLSRPRDEDVARQAAWVEVAVFGVNEL